jgi:hypothetical protein
MDASMRDSGTYEFTLRQIDGCFLMQVSSTALWISVIGIGTISDVRYAGKSAETNPVRQKILLDTALRGGLYCKKKMEERYAANKRIRQKKTLDRN